MARAGSPSVDSLSRKAWGAPPAGVFLLCPCPLGGAGEEEGAGRASAAGLSERKAQIRSQAHGEHLSGGLRCVRQLDTAWD